MHGTGSTRWGILVAVVSLAGSALSWHLSGGGIFSPGGLSAVTDSAPLGGVASHAGLEHRCAACHAPPFTTPTMRERCLECHQDVARELADSNSLHGSLAPTEGCISCHTEHRGARASLTRFDGTGTGLPQNFLKTHVATWGSSCGACHGRNDRFLRRRFSHDSTSWPLQGEHFRVPCEQCHQGVRALAGFRATPTDCNGCHQKDDAHRGGYGSDCAACHDATSWEAATFEHTFPITHGEGGRVACRTCHQETRNWKRYTCYGCHAHAPARVAAQHQEEGIGGRDLGDCVRCHRTGQEHEGGGERED